MDILERREEAFEKRFAMQEEFRFRALARRNKALGLWAASLIGFDGAEADDYANVLVEKQVDYADDEVLAKALGAEFSSAKVDMSDHRIRRRMAQARARREGDRRREDSRSLAGAPSRPHHPHRFRHRRAEDGVLVGGVVDAVERRRRTGSWLPKSMPTIWVTRR